MSNKPVVFKIVLGWVLLSVVLGACTSPTPKSTTAPTAAPVATAAPTTAPAAEPQKLILGTTTSTYDSGLLDYILPDFEAAFNAKVEVVSLGTGQAIQLGKDGNADVLLVHARSQEDAFIADGHGTRREDVMYNDFVIVGPSDDPAGIKGMKNASRALETLATAKAAFISRGDDSGTHSKEKSLWKAANIEPSGDWYVSAGQGMGAVLSMAEEQQAYTLSDRATYLARTLEGLKLEILVEGDTLLFNPYGVMNVNPEKNPNIKGDLANQFIDWLISVPVQEKIGAFGVDKFGAPLFVPDSQPWRDAQTLASPGDTALKVSGKVAQALQWTEAEVKAMQAMDVEAENSKGEKETYTGVPFSALLALAQPQSDAATLLLMADDGYTVEIPLADVQACENCIVSFRSEGGFTSRMPGFAKNTTVKGLIEIQVK
ncbi:MAG TPA: substrate-binding domain-containing protein [Anaerolineae bacterium]|nr:substrate-binding domain-containing protein [Anaerolineae bacterium]